MGVRIDKLQSRNADWIKPNCCTSQSDDGAGWGGLCLPKMTVNVLIFNFKWNFQNLHNNLVPRSHCLSNSCLWISWWNSLPMGNTDVLIFHRNGATSSQDRQIPFGNMTDFVPPCLIHCCRPTFPDSVSDNNLATMTARANQQDSAWKPSNHSWHIQGFPMSCHTFWSLTATVAPTWATLWTSGSFPSCFQQDGSFPGCPREPWQSHESEVDSCWLFRLGKLKTHFLIFLNWKFSHFPLSGKFWNVIFCSNSVQNHTGIHCLLSSIPPHHNFWVSASSSVFNALIPLKITLWALSDETVKACMGNYSVKYQMFKYSHHIQQTNICLKVLVRNIVGMTLLHTNAHIRMLER